MYFLLIFQGKSTDTKSPSGSSDSAPGSEPRSPTSDYATNKPMRDLQVHFRYQGLLAQNLALSLYVYYFPQCSTKKHKLINFLIIIIKKYKTFLGPHWRSNVSRTEKIT